MSMGGSTAQPTQTTSVKFSPEQKQLWNFALPGIKDYAATVPDRYQGTTIADFDPLQTRGQNMALDAAGLQSYLNGGAVDANKFLLGDIWNPESNPALRGAVDAAVRPITENYEQVVRPHIRDEFQQAGQQFGGSQRMGAEAKAGTDYLRTVGDTSSKLVQDQYSNNLTAMVRALGLTPQTMQASLAPAQTVSGVGDIRQALTQAQLGENVSNFYADDLAGYLQSKDLLSILSGLPGGTATSTANNPPGAPKWQQALGGAASGASMGAMFGPPGMLVGGGIGALMPFLS